MISDRIYSKFFLTAVSLSALTCASLYAADRPLSVYAEFELEKNRSGETLFELMSKPGGIKAKLDEDYAKSFQIVDAKTFRQNASHFAAIPEMERKIKGGARGLDQLISKLAGKSLTEDKMYGTVYNALKAGNLFATDNSRQQSRLAGALAPVIGLMSGKGVLVQIDSENYCYNYGYAKGSGGSNVERDKEDRKSGRSYGASIARNAYDPSDNDYLKELSAYISTASDREATNFYRTLFEILLKSDSSGLKDLSHPGQVVMADFLAIYMAELDRHLMTGLTKYEWENALTEITMLAAYSAHSDGKTLDISGGVDNSAGRTTIESDKIKSGDRLLGFFGVGTDGSGLDGQNKKRRHDLTKQIVREESKLNAAAVSKIEKLVGARAGVDIYDDVMNKINDFKTQGMIKKNAKQLIDALVDFVMNTRADAEKISRGVK
ncbi:MAG: hypothetical protein AABZ55_15365 [Bdellovibrionota bacterium]